MQEMQERPCGAIGEAVVQSGVSRKEQAWLTVAGPCG